MLVSKLDKILNEYLPFYQSTNDKAAYFKLEKPEGVTITAENIEELQNLEYELKTRP